MGLWLLVCYGKTGIVECGKITLFVRNIASEQVVIFCAWSLLAEPEGGERRAMRALAFLSVALDFQSQAMDFQSQALDFQSQALEFQSQALKNQSAALRTPSPAGERQTEGLANAGGQEAGEKNRPIPGFLLPTALFLRPNGTKPLRRRPSEGGILQEKQSCIYE